jgi:HTH-type transcriptional regulator / antitoxin HigA
MNVKPIRDEATYQEALEQIDAIWSKAAPGTRDSDLLDVLTTLVEAYERTHHAIPPPDPVDAIKFRMEQQQLDRAALQRFIGTKSKVSEVLARKRQLSLAMIRKLHSGLDIPAESLIRSVKLVTRPSAGKDGGGPRSKVKTSIPRQPAGRRARTAPA